MALRAFLSTFAGDQRGAIAALYGVALFALVAIAGVAFDYARLVSVDTELQNAADEAALAAATQLDGKSDSITRAEAAVRSYFANSTSDVVNRTLIAGRDAQSGSAITGVTFTFYTSYDRTADSFGTATTTGTTAMVVNVHINARRAYMALTPVVGALSSADITADAVAGLDAAICKTPPMMVCGPVGTDFPSDADIGKGILLQPGSAGAWAPGTFGYLDFGKGATTVQDLLGNNSGIDACATGPNLQAQTGNIASAPKYLNTRFDVYENPLVPADCASDGANCPAASTRKDLLRREETTFKNQTTPPARPACSKSMVTNNGAGTKVDEWVQLPLTALPSTNAVQGFPRDTCHTSATSNSNGTCVGGNVGDGVWNLSGYLGAHPDVPTNLTTRYAIYKWERDNPGTGLQPTLVNTDDAMVTSGCHTTGGPSGATNCDYTWVNYCSYPTGIHHDPDPIPLPAKDRRVFTVAVVDCSADTGGSHNFPVKKWMDVFLTEPSWDRDVPYTRASQIYAEVIGPATTPGGGNAFQYYGRNKAVLLR